MNIISFEKINSTNTYAKSNIDTLIDRTIISADVQTHGYGRFDRKWVDLGVENIYMSFILKPSDTLCETHANLTQYLSVCLCEEIENIVVTPHPSPPPQVGRENCCNSSPFKNVKGSELLASTPTPPEGEGWGGGYSIQPQIKWPNDVLLNGKKVCGILAESIIKGGKLKGIVLGIGVNLNASIDNLNEIDRPATSLNIELGKNINKKEFMQNLIDRFFANYDEFLQKGFVMIKDDYEARSMLCVEKGKKNKENIKIAVFNIIKEGKFNGFDNNGNLLLLNKDGKLENINMGEIVG